MIPEKSSSHWAQMGELTFVFGIWFLYCIHLFLGRVPFQICLYPVVVYYWATQRVARNSSMEYLFQIHTYLGIPVNRPTWWDSLKHFFSFAETLLDKTLAVSGRYDLSRVKFEGELLMSDRIKQGEGGVFITSHTGCLELCQALARQQPGMRIHVLVHTKHAEKFNMVLQRLNPKNGLSLMQVTEVTPATAIFLAEKVAQGDYVAIAGDRIPVFTNKRTHVHANFLGREAKFPIGPYVLASLLKCPLFFLGCIRENEGHTLVIEALVEKVNLPRDQRTQVIRQLVQLYASRLEYLLARSPYEWFNFFPFWNSK